MIYELSEDVLNLKNVSKYFYVGLIKRSTIKAVDGVSLNVKKGEILGLLGESGSGKSTIAKLILKILKPTRGAIYYRERNIWEIDSKEYYTRVQGVFQDPYASFNPRRKVLDILIDVLLNYYPKIERSKAYEVINNVLEKVGISIKDVVNKYPHEFSGGQLQRISIARALLVKPEIIIADEPVSMVDASTRIDILNIFIELKKEGLTSVIIGHDLSLIHYVSDRVAVMYKGQIVEEGPADILLDPLHPYTKMLLESIPRIDKKWSTEPQYKILPLEIREKTYGCVFADRCPFKSKKCVKEEPPLIDLGKPRVKCWLYQEA